LAYLNYSWELFLDLVVRNSYMYTMSVNVKIHLQFNYFVLAKQKSTDWRPTYLLFIMLHLELSRSSIQHF
jgi:hypothetical protein